MIEVEVCLFNSLRKYAASNDPFPLRLPEGTPVRNVARQLSIPESEIYVAFRNGRNIMTALGGTIEDDARVSHGDRIAFSGPVPFSRGYGAPVV